MDDKFIIEITSPIGGGSCMGRLPDGRAVFVPFTLPGETAHIRLQENKQKYAVGELLKILTPAPGRVKPLCPHYTQCGGCNYQHARYDLQLELKEYIIREHLERIGGIKNPPVQRIVAAPDPWNYRNSLQFHLTPEGKVGFLKPGSHQVIPIRECHLPIQEINDLWPLLEMGTETGVERIDVRYGTNEDLMIVMESESGIVPEFSLDIPLSIMHISPEGELIISGNGYVMMEVLDTPFSVSGGSFFQVNTIQAGAMVTHLIGELPLKGNSEVLDIYCGVGLFCAFIAPKVSQCSGVELSPSACMDFSINLDRYDNVALYEGKAEEILPSLMTKPDIVILDPPRAGLDRRALDAVVNMAAETLAYVSCDPATLARDIKRLLTGGYILEKVTPFDLFPQTHHLESISILRKPQR